MTVGPLSIMGVVNETKAVGKIGSWEDSFTVPLVTTRQIEKQLGSEIAANKDRLRALVGCVTACTVQETHSADQVQRELS